LLRKNSLTSLWLSAYNHSAKYVDIAKPWPYYGEPQAFLLVGIVTYTSTVD